MLHHKAEDSPWLIYSIHQCTTLPLDVTIMDVSGVLCSALLMYQVSSLVGPNRWSSNISSVIDQSHWLICRGWWWDINGPIPDNHTFDYDLLHSNPHSQVNLDPPLLGLPSAPACVFPLHDPLFLTLLECPTLRTHRTVLASLQSYKIFPTALWDIHFTQPAPLQWVTSVSMSPSLGTKDSSSIWIPQPFRPTDYQHRLHYLSCLSSLESHVLRFCLVNPYSVAF